MMINLSENFCVHSVGHMSLQKKSQGGFEKVRGISPTLAYTHDYKYVSVCPYFQIQNINITSSDVSRTIIRP